MSTCINYTISTTALENKMNIDKIETQTEEKPKRVKVEHIKLGMNAQGSKFWEVARDWAEGVREFRMMHVDFKFDKIDSNEELLALYINRRLFARIETEITERDEFIQEAMKHSFHMSGLSLGELRLVEKMFDSGRYKLVDGE